MRQKRVGGLVLLAFFICFLPAVAFGQYWEGGFRWSRMNSEMRAKIEALGDVAVTTFPIPVLLGVEVSDLTKNFGDPRDGGTRTHEGLDMLAPEGTPVASPTNAVVTRVGNGSGSGLYVRTANPGGESFVYMHLVAIAEGIEAGDVMQRGEVLGFVGNTGNASGGPAHLHFEIRENGAKDPYPRFTQAFTLNERMQGVAQALERLPAQAGGGSGYEAMYASRFAATFVAAQAQGIVVPASILALLDSVPAPAAPASSDTPSADGELVFGENNARIVELQRFLIAAASGSDAAYLSRSGATGYFGPITQAALVEYQNSVGLVPSGVVDDATYTQIFALSGEGDSSETIPEGEDEVVPTVSARENLVFNKTNANVVELQKFLIAADSGVATDRLVRAGATGYFGPITQAALVEYQRAAGLSPTGVVDDATYTQMFVLAGGDSSETVAEGEEEPIQTVYTRDLELGMRGEDVRALQVFLNTHGFLVAESAEGSPGQETTYFGVLTQAALAKYQAAQGIAPSVGYFGPITRGHITLSSQ